jgi:hypothetical protein
MCRANRRRSRSFGVYHPKKGNTCEILFTAKFPDLESAMYWAAKKEVHAVRRDKWFVASRVLWRHDLTPEQAVAAAHNQMKPQMDRAIKDLQRNITPDMGIGPLKSVDPSKAKGFYVEIEGPDGEDVVDPFFTDET